MAPPSLSRGDSSFTSCSSLGHRSSSSVSLLMSPSAADDEAAMLAAMMSCLKLAGWMLMSSMLVKRACPLLLGRRLSLPLDGLDVRRPLTFEYSLLEVSSPNRIRRGASALWGSPEWVAPLPFVPLAASEWSWLGIRPSSSSWT